MNYHARIVHTTICTSFLISAQSYSIQDLFLMRTLCAPFNVNFLHKPPHLDTTVPQFLRRSNFKLSRRHLASAVPLVIAACMNVPCCTQPLEPTSRLVLCAVKHAHDRSTARPRYARLVLQRVPPRCKDREMEDHRVWACMYL
jgi:hypothetical protein